MGIDTIKNSTLRENWSKFINMAHKILEDNNHNYEFTSFKNDGSYAKSKTSLKSTSFVFSQDSIRKWVELELRPVQRNKIKIPQTELYEFIKDNYCEDAINSSREITWNEEDISINPRDPDGLPIRIKIYLENKSDSEWVNSMIELMNIFSPILNKYKA